MKTKSVWLVLSFALILITALYSYYSDDYLIGGFSYNKNTDPSSMHVTIGERMQTGGFNAVVCTAIYEADTTGVHAMLSTMNTHNLDGILEDYIFDPETSSYGARTLSSGNHFRFEAEYVSNTADSTSQYAQQHPDNFFYMSTNANSGRVGHKIQQDANNLYSNHYCWQVDNGQAGYAYHDLTYKWPIGNSQEYYRVGHEFRFPYQGTSSYKLFNADTLFITFAMQVDGIENLPGDRVLADIRFTSKGLTTASNDSINVLHYITESDSSFISQLTKEQYINSPTDLLNLNIHLITVFIPVRSLDYQRILAEYAYWDKSLVNLNPNLYWYGHGTLKLDYIEFEDKLFRDYSTHSRTRHTISKLPKSLLSQHP
jgi:hypothetical protein